MILIIDNYDSFVYNLARYVAKLGFDYEVKRNDSISVDEIKSENPEAIIISPGPCTPHEAGISIECVKELGETIPILGVCLGHQAIGEAYGGKTIRALKPIHGKEDKIEHDGTGLFHNLKSPLSIGRYHSLITQLNDKTELNVTALSTTDEIMAIRHKSHPVYGVQFHPESVLTPEGMDIIKNFLVAAHDWNIEHERKV
ncbi:MAG: anthranilate synthase component II [Alphaproteobacteria bacterium]